MVQEAILSDNLLSPGNRFVAVNVAAAVVTLTGEIPTRKQMHAIVKKVTAVPGVKKVKNQMTVSKPQTY